MKKYLLIPLLFIFNLSYGQYCNAPFRLPVEYGAITNVTIGSFSNTSGQTLGANGWAHYCDSLPAITLYRDSDYVLSVTFDTVYPSYGTDNSWYAIGIPFDSTTGYDQFYTPIRFYRSGAVMSGSTPVIDTFHVHVPHVAREGITRMRIVRWGRGTLGVPPTMSPTLCNTSSPILYGAIGEMEEYNLNITNAPAIDTTHPVDTTDQTDTTHGGNNTLLVSGVAGEVFSIFPNPATDVIQFPYVKGQVVSIRDLDGRVLYKNSDFTGSSLPVKSLSSGLYLIYINDRNYLFRKD